MDKPHPIVRHRTTGGIRRVFWVGRSNIHHIRESCAPSDAEMIKTTDDEYIVAIIHNGTLCNRCGREDYYNYRNMR